MINQIKVDNVWVDGDPTEEGQEYRIKIPVGDKFGYQSLYYRAPNLSNIERSWRDSELLRTDSFVILPDYPDTEGLTTYRQSLRDYPESESFPNGTRPEE